MLGRAKQSSDLAHLERSLRLWRMLHRVKQCHAAELIGVSQAMISRWETGHLGPTGSGRNKLCNLLQARLTAAADRELVRLVDEAPEPIHLICDLTHRLLAMSKPREKECSIGRQELLGISMWNYASAEIVAAEEELGKLGWFEPAPPSVEVYTRKNASPDVAIREGYCQWIRFRLSDGSHARLVRTLDPVGRSGDCG